MIDENKLLQKIKNTYGQDDPLLQKGYLTVFDINNLGRNAIAVHTIQQNVSLAVIQQGSLTTYVYRRVIKGKTMWAINKLRKDE